MIKQVVLEILDYLKFQVANDKCTPEELRSVYNTLTESLNVDATISDLAEYYGQSQSNVRNAIARGYPGKPKRRVYYNFIKFAKRLPQTWKRNT